MPTTTEYKIMREAYEKELDRLWQRSIFLATFMTLAWGGYSAFIVNFLKEKITQMQIYTTSLLWGCALLL